ncbi:ADP-ribosyl cyclase/cyclic ADP-ribose hydrolase-like [Rhopilema esculentum]|uniref:ADP-ribosyl cyclase/cyclic ADP-ribose hydrolase-like n=1 Tax=Rhopilema esculentum TaxID=499914 RepID=UPI0031D26BBF
MYTIFFIILQLCISRAGAGQGNGTTANIKEIFTGRCFDYLEFRYSSGLQGKNCTDLFRIFEKEFNNNTKCSDDFSGMFTDFFQAVDQGPTSKDRALFWSGTMSVAHSISKVSKDYITLEDTFPGYIANDLNFCGEDTVGFNYAQCSCKWDSSQKKVFWQKASTQFAKNARGNINVLINGTRHDQNAAYRNTSIFATVELPNLNPSAVTLVKILVGMDLDRKPRETCGHKSIKKLRNDIEARNMTVQCIDEPRIVFDILCTIYKNENSCRMIQKLQVREKGKTWMIVAYSCIGACLILLIIVACTCNRSRKRRNDSDVPYLRS